MHFFLSILLVSASLFTSLKAEVKDLSDHSTISLLTTSPTSTSVVSMFGHTAIRVKDPAIQLDYTFNYGVFDDANSSVRLLLTVFLNKLKSELWVMPFKDFYHTAQKEQRSLTEHLLNLTPEEKIVLWHLLIENAREENRGYVFDFFVRNCTTFPRDLIKDAIGGDIVLRDSEEKPTYREVFTKYSAKYPWTHFLLDMIVGSNLDKVAYSDKHLYIPQELENAWRQAVIKNSDGDIRPVFSSSTTLFEPSGTVNTKSSTLLTPFIVAFILLVIMVIVLVVEWKKKVHFSNVDNLVFGFLGFAGLILYVYKLGFPSWYVQYDWLMLLVHPLHLIVPVASLFRLKISSMLFPYHMLTMLVVVFLVTGHFFLPQHFNIAQYPLMGCVFLRSFSYVLSKS